MTWPSAKTKGPFLFECLSRSGNENETYLAGENKTQPLRDSEFQTQI